MMNNTINKIKSKIIAALIVSLVLNTATWTYAGQWIGDGVGLFYFYDDTNI